MRPTVPAASKEVGGKEFIELDAEEAEERYRHEPVGLHSGKNLRCPVGDDRASQFAQKVSGHRGKSVHIR